VSLRRGNEIELTLPPKVVHVLELVRVGGPLGSFESADLALSPLELKVGNGTISGVAHNIGVVGVERTTVSLIAPNGKVVQAEPLGKLDAPVDLKPRTATFEFLGLPKNVNGWTVMLDLQDLVPELNEANNRLTVGK